MNNFCIKWSVDVIRYTHLVGFLDTGRRILTGDHDYRNIINPLIFIQKLQNLKSIHDRQRNIMRELEEYESTKEHLMESITQDIQKECSEIENDTDLDFIGGAKRKYD